MSIFSLQQRVNLSRDLTGLEKQDIYDAANRSIDPKSVGKMRLRRYAIAIRPVMGQWDNNDPIIINARNAFDKGFGVMFSERTKEWCILYYQSHIYRVKRKAYFNVPAQEE